VKAGAEKGVLSAPPIGRPDRRAEKHIPVYASKKHIGIYACIYPWMPFPDNTMLGGKTINIKRKRLFMDPIILICLIFGIHIVLARGITGIISGLSYNWIVGLVEGIPLLLSCVLIIFQIPWAFIFFVFAFFIYFSGSFLKYKLDKNTEKYYPAKWGNWNREKKKINILIRILLLIY